MSRTAKIIWSTIGIVIVFAMLFGAVVLGFANKPTQPPCSAIEYVIKDQSKRMYLTEKELDVLLRSEDIHPVGRQLNKLSLHRIEHLIGSHPMVRTAECYLTPRNEVCVKITQRVPLLRVQTASETYLIDTDRKVMQARAVVQDSIPVVTGTVGVQMASGALGDFAEWLQDHPYWSKKIHHIYVQSPHMIYLYIKGDEPRIVLGSMRDFERKLQKMRTFYEHAQEVVQDKHYTEYDVRFRGQVIGRTL